ncbi:MAG: TonB-dependent receptor, partial [Terracidiphilus sp.]
VAGFTVLQSGFPVLITDGGVYNSLWCDGFSYYGCPDVPETSSFNVSKDKIRANVNSLYQYFNTSSFSQEPIGTFGNVKRNYFHGPGFNYTDMSLFKVIPLGRETARSVQLMMQAQNVFNHANFAPPDGNYTDGPYFGTVSGVDSSADYNGDPAPGRTVQLVGKFVF